MLEQECNDVHELCPTWAKIGECQKNQNYMEGDGAYALGACRLSCGKCLPCALTDGTCRQRNRELAGFLPQDMDEE